jgi:hypothetical protein
MNEPHQLSQSDSLLNRVAWKWLREAKESPVPRYPHLLTLAQWGMDNGVEGD